MGGLEYFHGVMNHFPPKGYKVWYPNFRFMYALLKTNVKSFAKFLRTVIVHKGLEELISFR